MKEADGIGRAEVKAVYEGQEGDVFQLMMGQQIHVGGFRSTMDLAERAGIGAGDRGVDLCCGNGAGMRALVRFREVAGMTGIEAAEKMAEHARRACREEGLEDRIEVCCADACASGLPDGEADFVWGEDAWCYVPDKEKLVAEAVRLLRPGGTVAFTDWVEGPTGLAEAEAEGLLRLMKFPNIQDVNGYRLLLEKAGLEVVSAEDTDRFARYFDLYRDMIDLQLTYDALRIVGFERSAVESLVVQLGALAELGRAGKIAQARFVARA